jgi:membrane-bound ClpP family serine protease
MGKTEKWPWIPAGICFALAVLILALSGALVETIAGWVWALILILAGVFFVVRALNRKQ